MMGRRMSTSPCNPSPRISLIINKRNAGLSAGAGVSLVLLDSIRLAQGAGGGTAPPAGGSTLPGAGGVGMGASSVIGLALVSVGSPSLF